jgi:EAL domain-containing protein (putative c-di-GMP-specific phosphodiesterase class I)
VPPNLFGPLAEQNGLSSALDQWVLRRACADAAALRSLGFLPAAARVAVNISANNVGDVELLRWVQEAAAASALPLDALEVEVTETALLADAARAGQALSALRRLGVTVALDDFGTGFSSLRHLREIPLATFKIDRSFTRDLDTDPDAVQFVRALLSLGRDLGLDVVAEGVERAGQASVLADLGCQFAQGWFYDAARPAAEVRWELDAAQTRVGAAVDASPARVCR